MRTKPNLEFEPAAYRSQLLPLLRQLAAWRSFDPKAFQWLIKQHPRPEGGLFAKDQIIQAYHFFTDQGELAEIDASVIQQIRRKPVRTLSGITSVTVLTRPHPCPGECIFCPNDVRMPKSYLRDEPGAQRAERNRFDPYLQTYNRLLAYRNVGHPTAKVELIVLGGTWSFYPEAYQIWFIKRCFDALNDFSFGRDSREDVLEQLAQESPQPVQEKSEQEPHQSYNYRVTRARSPDVGREHASWAELEAAQRINEDAASRCVGLVIETRPDYISEAEVIRIRRLGCTKTQIGIQSLRDEVLELNRRGHDVAASRRAFRLLRAAGLKIHAHWMPNLYGSNVEQDRADFDRLFADPDFLPDELKIYPCSLIENTELVPYFERGEWRPYTRDELLEVLVHCLKTTPSFCRLTRIIRDIPGTDIVAGNKTTNFREVAERELRSQGGQSRDIRSREIRGRLVSPEDLRLEIVPYSTSTSEEGFLQYVTEDNRIVGFLRLSLPKRASYIAELEGSAIIREVHVYGQALSFDQTEAGKAQHIGLGARLIREAESLATEAGFADLAVISSVGTRNYYRKLGFIDGTLYQHKPLCTHSS